jgi:putative PIN family toxin of toxin-antitoxin system
VRVVLDANILVRAFTSEGGSAHSLVELLLAPSHRLILSNEILQETARVLRYSRFNNVHRKNDDAVYAYVESLRGMSDVYAINLFTFAPIRDPEDAFVIQTALSAKADAICSLDRDFFSPPASTFLAKYGIEVVTDVQLLHRLRQ